MFDQDLNARFRELVFEGDLDGVREHLDQGAEVNGRNIGWHTALMDAAMNGNQPMLALLLERGAEIDGVDGEYGTTALHKALPDHLEAARFLLEQGADPLVGQETPVKDALDNERSDVLQLLIDGGLDPNDDRAFNRPLLMQAASIGSIPITELLLRAGADPDREDSSGYSPLREAAMCREADVVRLLADHGASADLELAAFAGLVDRVRELLDGGVDPDYIGVLGETALQSALMMRHLKVLRLLVERGADVNAGEGPSLLEKYKADRHPEIHDILSSATNTD